MLCPSILLNAQLMKKLLSILFLILFCNGCKKESVNKEINNNTYSYEGPRFVLLPPDSTGVDFTNKVPETPELNVLLYQYLHNGAGVSVGDINNDGLDDLFFTQNFGPNHLYLNLGDLKFKEIGREAGIGGKKGWSTGTTLVDINADGLLDIYVCRSGNLPPDQRRNALFINNGDLTFTDQASAYGLDSPAYSTQASFFDYDQDGDLDMYLLNHPITPLKDEEKFNQRDPFTTDQFFQNNGNKFSDISKQVGILPTSIGYGLSATVSDFDNNGFLDIYVCNDYLERDFFYLNDGTQFHESLTSSMRHTSNFSMGSDAADINHDGLMDLMVLDMVAEDNYRIKTNMSGMDQERFEKAVENGFHYQYMMNTLQLNNGNHTFSEISQLAGVSNTDWSWAALFADYDNDGLQDLFITNGLRKDARNNDFVKKKKKLLQKIESGENDQLEILKEILDAMPVNPIANYIYKNQGDLHFSNQQEAWGFTEKTFSNGAAYSDLDNDGDLDLIISNIDQASMIYENKTNELENTHFLKIQLKGASPNPFGIGARLTVFQDGQPQIREQILSRGYQSSVSPILHFGLTDAPIEKLQIRWPDGKFQEVSKLEANQQYTIEYAPTTRLSPPQKSPSLFSENKEALKGFRHTENEYNDFEKEILLPHRLSVNGPALASYTNDKEAVVFMGAASGKASQLSCLYSEENSGSLTTCPTSPQFIEKSGTLTSSEIVQMEDTAAAFFDMDNDGDMDLYVATGGHQHPQGSKLLRDRLYINEGNGKLVLDMSLLPDIRSNAASIAVSDYDSDGDVDLFIGARSKSQAYPEADRSYLLENRNGTLVEVTQTVLPEMNNSGMVNAVLWEDITGDGQPELVTAGEWTAINVWQLREGSYVNISDQLGLSEHRGWWFSLAAADMDGDGDNDILAGNLGLNYKYQASPEKTFDLYYGDFDKNQQGDIVLTYQSEQGRVPVRGRQCSSQQMPYIKEKFEDYDAFAKANIDDILPEGAADALVLKASTFATSFIENKGNEPWELSALPTPTQLSSTHRILLMDVDEDGDQDALLAGNLYESEVETPRNDAGNGVVLLNDGKGNFKSLSIEQSGFFTPGNVKSGNLINIENQEFIIIGNNNGAYQLFEKN